MAGYSIIGINQTTRLLSNNTRQDVVDASFETDDGDGGTVTVELADGWPDAVQAAAGEQAAGYQLIRSSVNATIAIGQISTILSNGARQPTAVIDFVTVDDDVGQVRVTLAGDWAGQAVAQLQHQILAYATLRAALPLL